MSKAQAMPSTSITLHLPDICEKFLIRVLDQLPTIVCLTGSILLAAITKIFSDLTQEKCLAHITV